jgi:hypothetical protein
MSQPSNATAQVFVVNVLKKSRKWFTLAELELEAKVKITPDLLELLKKNEYLNFDATEKKFSYKFDSTINNKEDILKYIEEKPLLLDDKVLSSYVTLKDDVEVINCPNTLSHCWAHILPRLQLFKKLLFFFSDLISAALSFNSYRILKLI